MSADTIFYFGIFFSKFLHLQLSCSPSFSLILSCIHTHTCTHTCKHAHTHMQARAHSHAHTHTYTLSRPFALLYLYSKINPYSAALNDVVILRNKFFQKNFRVQRIKLSFSFRKKLNFCSKIFSNFHSREIPSIKNFFENFRKLFFVFLLISAPKVFKYLKFLFFEC